MLDILKYLIAGGVVLCLPGIAWWTWFPKKDRDILERIAEVVGMSIASTALLALGFFLLDWRLTTVGVGAIYGVLGLLAAAGLVRRRITRKRNEAHTDGTSTSQVDDPFVAPVVDSWQRITDSRGAKEDPAGKEPGPSDSGQLSLEAEQSLPGAEEPSGEVRVQEDRKGSRTAWIARNAVLLAALAVLLAWRFYQVRELVLPAWVDSLHHTLIVQVILENGGLPDTLAPYMQVPFSYHYAFHALAAGLASLTRLGVPQVVLVLGQVLNALVAVSVYRLGIALWGNRRRAGAAALLVGFVFQMPAYYATWGRYTLLTGLVLLPLAIAAGLDIVNVGALGKTRRKRSLPGLAKLALLTAGVLLTHYFAALLLALFFVILGLQVLAGDVRRSAGWRNSRWLPLTVAVVSGAILASPWIIRMLGFNQEWVSVAAVSPTESLDSYFFPNYVSYLWRMLGPKRNYVLLALALSGLPTALWRSRTRAFGVWALALVLFSLPWGVHLSPFRPDHAVIVLFLPGSLLVADFIFTARDRLHAGRFRGVGHILVAATLLSLLIWGLWETRFIINSATVFTSQADLEAIGWVEANTPPEARFLTNVTHWQYNTYRGEDGGWWIMPLTGRETLLPPVLYVMGAQDYVEGINGLAESARYLEECSPEFWDLVQEAGVTHIYLVEGRGSLQPEGLEGCDGLSLVYARGGVSIFEMGE